MTLQHLVVGMNGTIGSALYHRLQGLHASVVGTTQRTGMPAHDSVRYLNLSDPSTFDLVGQYDVAYFCAGICRMAACESDPIGTAQINIDASLALAKYLAAQGTFIIYLSTNQVFSGEDAFVKADAKASPLNEYGRQKARIEALLREHIEQLAIVRLAKVVEPGFKLITDWISALNQNQPVRAFQDMILAPVTLRQVIDILIKIGNKMKSGTYQISGSEDISYYQLALILANWLKRPPELIQPVIASEAGIQKTFLPRFTTMDCSSIIADFNESPPRYDSVLRESFAGL